MPIWKINKIKACMIKEYPVKAYLDTILCESYNKKEKNILIAAQANANAKKKKVK